MSNQPQPDLHLSAGATGFRSSGAEPLQLTDAEAFASACYQIARRSSGRIIAITPPGVTPNFHTALLNRGERQIAVLGHIHLPLLAIAEPPDPSSVSVVFTEDSPVRGAQAALSPSFRLLTRDELTTPLTVFDLSDLDLAEHRQIAYWKPENLGQLLFNYWD